MILKGGVYDKGIAKDFATSGDQWFDGDHEQNAKTIANISRFNNKPRATNIQIALGASSGRRGVSSGMYFIRPLLSLWRFRLLHLPSVVLILC